MKIFLACGGTAYYLQTGLSAGTYIVKAGNKTRKSVVYR